MLSRLNSPASPLFTQPFIRAQIKKNIKAPRHWPLCGEFTGDRRIPRTNGQLRGRCFHLMTSSWSTSNHDHNGRRLWKRFPYYWSFVRVSTGDTQIHGNGELWRFLSCWIEHSGEQIFRLQTVEWFDTHVITRPSVSPTGGVVSAVHTRPAAIKVTRGPYTHAIGSHNAVIYTHIRVVEAVAFWNKKPFTVNPLNLCMMNKHFVIRATLSIQVAELRIHKQTRCGTRFDTQ